MITLTLEEHIHVALTHGHVTVAFLEARQKILGEREARFELLVLLDDGLWLHDLLWLLAHALRDILGLLAAIIALFVFVQPFIDSNSACYCACSESRASFCEVPPTRALRRARPHGMLRHRW